MKNEISLVESRTFWVSLLSLVAIVANQFHWIALAGIAANPETVTNILNLVTFVGVAGAMMFRTLATAKVTSVLPAQMPPIPPASTRALALLFVLAVAGGATFGLGGCSTIATLTSPALTPTQVIVAANAFDALESTATTYLSLPTCPTATPVCKTAAGVAAIVPPVRAGRAARNTLEAAVNSGKTPLSVSAYTTLTTAVTALQATMAQYASVAK
jgi:hypothetical protein